MFLHTRTLAVFIASFVVVLAAGADEAPSRMPTNVVFRSGVAPVTQHTENPRSGERAKLDLPAAPEGVTDLKFAEFFRNPVGRLGLEYSDKLRDLKGKRVRLLGYMVRQDKPIPHRFLLAPMPITLHEQEYGLCDDLPATVVHVWTDASTPPTAPFTPGLLLLTGVLDTGNQTEPCGRVSTVRMKLDEPTAEQRQVLMQVAAASDRATNSAAAHRHDH